jgi:hypothetical protein
MSFYIWASLARYPHAQAWLTVTYEFDATSSNDMFVSLLLPMEVIAPFGGPTSADPQMATRDLWIEEPLTVSEGGGGVIVTKHLAYYLFWDEVVGITGMAFRLGGSGGYTTYTDSIGFVGGSIPLMIRNDSAHTLARGVNTVIFDCYRTDTNRFGTNTSGFWIVNYVAGKPSGGYGAANHTVFWNLGSAYSGTGTAFEPHEYSAVAPVIPEADYFLTALGVVFKYQIDGLATLAPSGVTVLVERLASGENGLKWEEVYGESIRSDLEWGLRTVYGQAGEVFTRWAADPDIKRLPFETARRWRTLVQSCPWWDLLDLVFTYHTVTFPVTGDISNTDDVEMFITLHRRSNGETLGTTSRTGDGSYSITWYDNTEELFTEATADDLVHEGRSASYVNT